MRASEYLKRGLLLIPALLSFHCANQLPPGGGEADLIPPKIVSTYPENRTTGFGDNYFEIEFSEYVDKRTFKDAIFISPPVDGNLEVSWTNRYARVFFPSELRPDMTYSISIGTDVVDYNNRNRMDSAFTFAFSTGEKIDNGKIEGFVSDEKPSGIMLFAYRIEGDTIDPSIHKPDYISQAGTNGYFKLDYLAYGKYRIFAVKDEFRDRVFQPEQDLIGMPHTDIPLSEEDSAFYGLNYVMQKIDTTGPKLFSAVMTDRQHILLTLSEEADTSAYKRENFSITDSAYRKIANPLFVFKGRTKEKELVLVTDTLFREEESYYLLSENLRDRKGNLSGTDTVEITVSVKPDTLKPVIYSTEPNIYSDKIDFAYPEFIFRLDDATDMFGGAKPLAERISFGDTVGNRIKFDFRRLDDGSYMIKAAEELKPETYYEIKFMKEDIKDAAGNSYRDSLYNYAFKTITGLEFTGLSGTVKYADTSKNPLLILRNKDEKKLVYRQKLKSDATFEFERIVPGTYFLTLVHDENGNGEIDAGFPYPFVPAESFSTFREEIKLPARWSVTNFNFIYNERIF